MILYGVCVLVVAAAVSVVGALPFPFDRSVQTKALHLYILSKKKERIVQVVFNFA